VKTFAVDSSHTNVLGRPNRGLVRDACLRQVQRPNEYDACLMNELDMWEGLVGSSGLTKICCPMGRRKYATRPWVQMPAEGRQFKPVGVSDVIGNIATDSNIAVLQTIVPIGYDGVITDFVCEVVPSSGGVANGGFVEGSGQIHWRLSADRRYLRDLGDIQVTMGSLVQPSPVPRGGLRVYSKNLIEFDVNITGATAALLDPLARIVCSVTGWFYAR